MKGFDNMNTLLKWLNENNIEYYIKDWGIIKPSLRNLYFIYNNKAVVFTFILNDKGGIKYGDYFVENIETGIQGYTKNIKKAVEMIDEI